MRKPFFVFVGGLCFALFTGSPNIELQFHGGAANALKPAALKVDTDYGKMPLYFIPNQGQLDKQVAYYVQGKDKTLYFTEEGITFALTKPADRKEVASKLEPGRWLREENLWQHQIESERWVLKLEFLGANKNVKPLGKAKTGAVISYFRGKPEEWQTGLPTYSEIVYPNLWPGIDLVYHGTVNRLKYEFVVHPGADPSRIQLAYRGAEKVSLDGEGRLNVTWPAGNFNDDVPAAYQEVGGEKFAVSLAYKLKTSDKKENFQKSPNKKMEARSSERTHKNLLGEESEVRACVYGFDVGPYDHSQTLVLDPAFLVCCGFIGGSSDDWSSGIDVDASGNVYITGSTSSTESTFPVAAGPDLIFNGGSLDAFVAKINAYGTALVYCGYIGGSDDDLSSGIGVDASGNVYITGSTSSTEATFPVTMGPDLSQNSYIDAFVAKVNASGTALLYCGYIGGNLYDYGYGIAVDGAGNAYVTGSTSSYNNTFPVIVGPDLTHNSPRQEDAFVAKVNPSGTALLYCGYIGGSDYDYGYGITVDGLGNAYVTGATTSTNSSFPVTVGPDLNQNGYIDAFVAKVNAAGTALAYCGYIGGSSYDYGYGIAVDGSGNAYVTGETSSTETSYPASFPVTVGPDLSQNGYIDAFVAKVNAAGTALVYCGFIGGDRWDSGQAIAVDGSGNAYMTGRTESREATFPVTEGPDLTFNGGQFDCFAARVNALGTGLVYCGYIGGSNSDSGMGIALDGSGNACVTGKTESNEGTFPVTVGPDLTFNGGSDAFVAKVFYLLGAYVLDGYGGVHAGGGAPAVNLATPYFGWDIAKDIELAPSCIGYYVLDGYGGIHKSGAAPVLAPATPYFGWDIARDLELTESGTGYYVLDGYGGIHAGGWASSLGPLPPYFGWDVARDLELAPGAAGCYVLDGYGGIHAGGGALLPTPASPYFGWDIARDLETAPAGTGYYVLDGFGGIHRGGDASPLSPGTPYFGWDIAKDMEITASGTGCYVLDGYGGVHVGGSATELTPATPYFGWNIARALAVVR